LTALTPVLVNVSTGPASVVFEFIVQDDLSGFREALVVADGGTSSVLLDGSISTGKLDGLVGVKKFNATFDFFALSSPGTYSLQVSLFDAAGNEKEIDSSELSRLGFPSGFEVVNTNTDFEPPFVVDLTFLSPTTVDVSLAPVEVEITVIVEDDGAGFQNGTAYIISPVSLSNVSFSYFSIPEPRSQVPLAFNLSFSIPQYIPSGTYSVAFVLSDAVGNSDYSELPYTIDVINANGDDVPPELLNFTLLSPQPVDVSDGPVILRMLASVEDDFSGVYFAYASLTDKEGTLFLYDQVFAVPAIAGASEFTFNITLDEADATSFFIEVGFFDAAGNVIYYTSDDLSSLGFPGTVVVVSN
jgi:hypothetical protein